MMTAYRLYEVLLAHPLPGSVVSLDHGGASCCVVVGASEIRYGSNWLIGGMAIACLISGDATAEQVHSEIRRVLALGYKPSKAEIEERLVEEINRRRDAEQALAKMTDAHAVVSQRLVGAQKEVAEIRAERDEATARAAKVAGLLRRDDELREQIAAALGLDGAASLALILDVVKEVRDALAWPEADPYPADIIKRAKAIRLDAAMYHAGRPFRDEASNARERLAAYLGMDGAGFAEIAEAIERDTSGEPRAGRADLLRLVGYHQAPIRFGDRPLTLAERAAFVIRRLWQGRTNAANEAAALRRELGDIADALGDLPDTAAREPIGDREDHLGLSTAERIRLTLTK
jgi:hypothetical protein